MSRTSFALPEELHAYLLAVGTRPDSVRLALREATNALPNSGMQISVEQGEFMDLLLKLIGAKKCLEIGTFTGYSALVTAQALPDDGKVICCDVSDDYTKVGKPFWAEAGVAHKIDLRIAPAVETLDALLEGGHAGTFDFLFIDADKHNYDHYYERGLKLLKQGGLIGIDNTLWSGKVIDDEVQDPDTVALRALNAKIHADPRVQVSMIPIGDGLTLCRKN
ncbi:class I SAM-dependent methyltransferase [Armatimonas rosea]|uniref:Putative O-methyltransferase YrrM n=1 Tax=Armatimonas rosea TaxID=685828 RepID=A0A7W9SSN0_ARMRO|nr:class I SAM-dependent methyltransferase [Armatimonas rosea]MBB6051239.1 putative O-methyltransferase YrrM [Armatimonas rosea]